VKDELGRVFVKLANRAKRRTVIRINEGQIFDKKYRNNVRSLLLENWYTGETGLQNCPDSLQ